MKKLLSKILCLVLALTVCFSLVACGEEEEPPVVTPPTVETVVPDGTMVDSAILTLEKLGYATDANDSSKTLMLAENGTSNYKIIVPAKPTKGELYAANDLQRFTKESLGVTLPIVYDNEGVVLGDNKQYYLSIGRTTVLAEAQKTNANLVPKFDELKIVGQLLALCGNTIFFSGTQADGAYASMVTFIEKQLGFEQFASDEYTIDKKDSQAMYNFGIFKYLPNVQFNLVSEGPGIDELPNVRARQRMMYETFVGGGTIDGKGLLGTYSHTLGTQILSNTNKNFFPNGVHLCYSNPDALKAVGEDILMKCNMMQKGDNVVIYEVGNPDDQGRCKCDNCEAYYKTHTNAEAYLNMLNVAAKIVREGLQARGVDTVVYLMGLMYNIYEAPPTKYNEITEEYETVSEDVFVDDWVMVRFTPIGSCHGHSWSDPRCETNNLNAVHYANGWASITDNMSLWTYGYIFHGQGTALMFPKFQALREQANYFEEVPYTLTRWQGSMREADRPFGEYFDYMCGKLYYDNEYDYDSLSSKFFAQYYKVAAPAMQAYYDLTMANFNAISKKKGYNNCIDSWYNNFVYDDKGDWDYDVLMDLEAITQEAHRCINESDLSEEMKETLRGRVETDAHQHLSFLLQDCQLNFSVEEYEALKTRYVNNIKKFGMGNHTSLVL